MCLYQTKMNNRHYEPTKKNGGLPPVLRDYRLKHIYTNCGWCMECRKEIANEWRIRLYEENKVQNRPQFITLHFAPEEIIKLENEIYEKKYLGIETDETGKRETDVNVLASYAIRKWTERWRKKNKKAPRHWIITELGKKSTERIHLHGILWLNKNENIEDIEKTWKYGSTDIGKWVDNRTINYIIKYVTKVDNYHKGYKPRVFTSKGIGKNYIINNNYNAWNGEKTITTYKTYNGHDIKLPRYWKRKLYTDEQQELLWQWELNKNTTWLNGQKWETNNEDSNYRIKYYNALKATRDSNKLSGYGDKTYQNQKYIITDIMKVSYKESLNYDKNKLVKSIKRRIIEESYENYDPKDTIGKHLGTKIEYYGAYIGTTTQAQRDYNKLLEQAKELKMSVTKYRLYLAGII